VTVDQFMAHWWVILIFFAAHHALNEVLRVANRLLTFLSSVIVGTLDRLEQAVLAKLRLPNPDKPGLAPV
jgi:hypothetical protein